jgi:DNA-directed RNA polymerase specialized sigma24 family protein
MIDSTQGMRTKINKEVGVARQKARGNRRAVEMHELAVSVKRQIASLGRRVGNADPEDLTELLDLERALRKAKDTAVEGLRAHGRSDAEIGRVLGVTREAVRQRFPRQKQEPTGE